MKKLRKLLNSKLFIASTAVVAVIAIGLSAVLMGSHMSTLPTDNTNTIASGDLHIETESNAENSAQTESAVNSTVESQLSVQVGGTTTTKSLDSSSPVKIEGGVITGTKTPATTASPKVMDQTASSTPDKGGVISVTPIPRPDAPPPASGNTPQTSEWISVNPNVPQELYNYKYTIIDSDKLLTGKQLEYRGFTDWDKAADAAVGSLQTYYTVDYRNIKSTQLSDKDAYLCSLVYWTGESAQIDICNYMKAVIDNQIISTASIITDRSLIYNNGYRLIRARVIITFQSGAAAYGLQNGLKYYKDVEVAVYASTGEDRYGYGKGADFNALLFSTNCFNVLKDFTLM